MIFLLNRERVLIELVELSRLRLVGWLGLPESQVVARIEVAANGSPKPVFEIDPEGCKLGSVAIQESIKAVYDRLKLEFSRRAVDLDTRWGDVKKA